MTSSYKQHDADVLSVVANESLGIAFSSGIDSQISLFHLIVENVSAHGCYHITYVRM
jgi:hypothetical protein